MRLSSVHGAATVALLLAANPALAQVVAEAGDDATLECASPDGTEFQLSGEGSSEGADIAYLWETSRDVDLDDSTVLDPIGTFPLGTTTATLTVTDTATSDSASDSSDVTVLDTTPPVVRVFPDPFVLWPPNHDLHEVEFRIRTRDVCTESEDLDVELVDVRSDEPDNSTGDGNTADDIQGADIGSDDRYILLRAERKGNGDGRVYTATYRVTDGEGNATYAKARVFVPHDEAQLKRLLDEYRDDDREDMDAICPTPTEAGDEFAEAIPRPASFQSSRECSRACRAWAQGCRGLTAAAGRCRSSELRAFAGLDAAECRDTDDRAYARDCQREVRDDYRAASYALREDARSARDTCQQLGRRCSDACDR